MLKEGVFLGKRYEVIERIGTGGMADVYKGKDHKLNRYVAIKVLKSDFRADETFIAKFRSEAQAAAGLMHPNVVNVYDVGVDRGLYYMVMELVEGITLKEYIEKKGRLSAKETISISIQMISGIEAAHNQHIIHRDIKPQNIIISREGKVKVTDFGIARAATTANTVSSNVMGSVHYTSPEQARGGAVDMKSDIYSAGITMYEMVTGHVPFDGDSTVSVAIKHLQEEIISPAEEVPDIPYSLECIIMKCTQKTPDLRYGNDQELIMDLKRSLVDPEGDFVRLGSAVVVGPETIALSQGEVERLHRQAAYEDEYEDEYDDEEYEDDYDDEESDDELDEDVNPKVARITKILMIVVAVIIAFAVIFMVGRAAGLFKFIPSITNTDSSEKSKVPDIVGMTEAEAIEALNKVNLGYKITERKASDKYDNGVVMEQKTAAGKRVDKNTQIGIVISTGKEIVEIQVPDVRGQSESDAQRILEDKKLVVADSKAEYSDDVEAGKVISTNPAAGATLKEGSKVTMVVSMGAQKAEVPNIVGMSREDASAALSAAGLSAGEVTEEFSDQHEAGIVISQATQAGNKVKPGSSVNFVVSKGAKVKMVTVPSLSGQNQSGAIALLQQNGLSVGEITEEYNSSVSKGFVISQTAAANSEVAEGTVVGFTISLGAEPSVEQDPSEDPMEKPQSNN